MVTDSFATGAVTVNNSGVGGGLVADNSGTISNSYSGGIVSSDSFTAIGGLVGSNERAAATISDSYSTGDLVGSGGQYVGGFVGYDENQGDIGDSYWDLDTSGITDPSQGAGNVSNDPGITGLTTEQFQSGLPPGFDPVVWRENPTVNGGFPYLIQNPPPN